MARDAELDRLKTAQDLTFQRKQDAYQAQQSAWERRKSAGDALNRARENKQRAYEAQDASWQDYQRIRSYNGSRIDQLKAQQENAYQNMKRAFDNASAAHARRDGAAASSYAADGHRYKDEAKSCTAERRQLINEIKSARARHEDTKPAFQRAKDEHDRARRAFDPAKAEHERKQADFNRAKANHDQASKAFRSRLEMVKAESSKRKADKRSIAEKAGVPFQYRDNVWISKDSNGNTNIYFGGTGTPNGPGHGHYVLDRNDSLTYKRDPFDPHGAQNFTDAQRDYSEVIGSAVAQGDEFGLRCRFRGYDAYVETNTNRNGDEKIDIYYGPNGPFGPGHHHAVAYRNSPYNFVSDQLR